nr:LOW QUALITY PROTEIN: interleukin-22 [Solea senegalensis]
MKLDLVAMVTSSSTSIRSVATKLLPLFLPLLLIGWLEQAASSGGLRKLSPPAMRDATRHAVHEVSKHAQSLETDDDSSVRLHARIGADQDHMKVCCLHANILNYYLTNILCHRHEQHPKMLRVKIDLSRVSDDLQAHGCNVTHYHDHHHAVEFRRKLASMEGERGINKAVGEIDILFTYLSDYCVHQKNNTANAANAAL